MTETEKKPATARDINEQAVKAMEQGGYLWLYGYCPPMFEMKKQHEVHERGFFSYLPLVQVKRKTNNWRQAPKHKRYGMVDSVVWKGGCYVAVREGEENLDKLRNPQIFTRFLKNSATGLNARISSAEMLRFVTFNKGRFSKKDGPEAAFKFKVGDKVTAIDHALTIESAIYSIQGNKAKVKAELFGSEHLVEISLDNLRNIEDI